MNYKKKIMWFFGLVLPILGGIIGFNYYVDPLWFGTHQNQSNQIQDNFNERQQKTTHITYNEIDYDSLLFGSSRTTYINQHNFPNMEVYNYAVSNMSIQEFSGYIDYAKELKNSDFDNLILGLDFFASNKNREIQDPLMTIEQVNEPFYRLKNLMSIDTIELSVNNLKASHTEEYNFQRNYSRSNVAVPGEVNKEEVADRVRETVKTYQNDFYGDTYEYNEQYKLELEKLVIENSQTEFLVFTTPVTEEVFQVLYEENRIEDYKKWLQDIIDVFGGVHHFMYINSVTANYQEHYYDGHHFLPHVGDYMIYKMFDIENTSVPQDFGIYLTDENIDEFFSEYIEQ